MTRSQSFRALMRDAGLTQVQVATTAQKKTRVKEGEAMK